MHPGRAEESLLQQTKGERFRAGCVYARRVQTPAAQPDPRRELIGWRVGSDSWRAIIGQKVGVALPQLREIGLRCEGRCCGGRMREALPRRLPDPSITPPPSAARPGVLSSRSRPFPYNLEEVPYQLTSCSCLLACGTVGLLRHRSKWQHLPRPVSEDLLCGPHTFPNSAPRVTPACPGVESHQARALCPNQEQHHVAGGRGPG